MPAPQKTHDLAACILTVDGARIEGFGPDEVIEFEWLSPLGEAQVGADGQRTFSRSNDKGAAMTVTLMETSLSYKTLAARQQAQELETPIGRCVVFYRNLISGDEFTEEYATFEARPAMSVGKNAGTRSFRIVLPNAGRLIKYGSLITV